MMESMILAAAVKPWALGAFIVLLGGLGWIFLILTEDNWVEHAELWELLMTACAIMLLGPLLYLFPSRWFQFMGAWTLEILIGVSAIALYLLVHVGRGAIRRVLGLRPIRRLKQGRPSPRGQGRRGKKGRR